MSNELHIRTTLYKEHSDSKKAEMGYVETDRVFTNSEIRDQLDYVLCQIKHPTEDGTAYSFAEWISSGPLLDGREEWLEQPFAYDECTVAAFATHGGSEGIIITICAQTKHQGEHVFMPFCSIKYLDTMAWAQQIAGVITQAFYDGGFCSTQPLTIGLETAA